DDHGTDIIFKESAFTLVTKEQKILLEEEKWRRFLYAPSIYWKILAKSPLVRLSEVAKVYYGIKTGKNEFFYMKKEQIDDLEIPDDLVVKLVKSIGQCDYIGFSDNDSEWHALNLEPIVKEAEERLQKVGPMRSLLEETKQVIKERKLTRLLDYIEKSEKRRWNEASSLKGRSVWFSLGNIKVTPLIFTKEIWKKSIIYINQGKLAVDQHLYEVYPHKDVDPIVLLGILNSDVTAIFRDLHGRIAAGQTMSRIENTVKEAKDLPIINPRDLTEIDKDEIRKAILDIVESERGLIPSKSEGTFFDLNAEYVKKRRALNLAVLKSIGFSSHIDEVENSWKEMIETRIRMGGQKKDILVRKIDENLERKLSGALVREK
ncbi:MAG: hypothetical protein ACFFD4_35990, partial [Candidatus Odinarchaeota archaeon]